MLYNVVALTKQIVPAGKQNAGQPYVEVTLEDPEDGEQRTTPVFDTESKRYLALIPTVAVGVLTPIPETAPDNLKVWTLCKDEEFTFPETMVRVNAQGQPELNKFNQMYVRKSVMVMTRKKRDNEDGTTAYRKGWDLTSRGTSVMNAFYMPLRVFANTAQGGEVVDLQRRAEENAALPV